MPRPCASGGCGLLHAAARFNGRTPGWRPAAGLAYALVEDRHGPRLELAFRARGAGQQVSRPVNDVANDLFAALDGVLKDNKVRVCARGRGRRCGDVAGDRCIMHG